MTFTAKRVPDKILILWNHPGDDDADTAGIRARAAHMAAVAAALHDAGFAAVHVNIADDLDRIIDSVVVEQPALIYNQVDSMYGDCTQHGAVASLYDLLDIPYTGSDPLCLASAAHLDRAETLLRAAGLPVPDLVPETDSEPEYRLFHVIAFASPDTPPLPITESFIVADPEPPPSVVAELREDMDKEARDLAQRAFVALGCRDAAQIDLSLEEGKLYVAEVCPVIDLAPGFPFAVAADASERGFAGAVAELARLALARARPQRKETAPPEPSETADPEPSETADPEPSETSDADEK